MDNFFQNINKRLNDIDSRQDITESAVTERDMGKHNNATTGFKALAKKTNPKIAGKQFQKMKKAGQLQEIGDTPAGKAALGSYIKKAHASGDAARMSSAYEPMGSKEETQARRTVQKRAGGIGQAVDRLTKENAEGQCSKCAPAPCSCDSMEEGAFKTQDIERQEREERAAKARHKGGLNQVPGVQNNKPHTKEHPLKNVAKGVKAFVQGKEEPMDEAKAKPDYIDLDHDGNKKETMKKAAADKKRSSGTAFDPDTRKQMKTDREGTGNFDKKKISTGTVYTRRHKEDDEEQVTSNEPKRKGRPKGPAKGPERVTAKSYKYKQGRPVKEMEIPLTSRGEYDQEGDEVKGDMHTVIRHAQELEKHLQNGENLPTWVIEKVGQIKGMMTSISDYMLSQHERSAEKQGGQEGIRIAEKAVGVNQRRAAGIAHAAQKGEIPKKELRGASKAMARMPAGELHKFASTKEKGLPKKVKEGGKPDFLDLDKDGNKTEPMKQAAKQAKGKKKEVEETTTAGSVATASNAAPKAKGMTFGKGVYEGAVNESYERKLRAVLNEGMNVTVNMNAEGQKSVNVSADGEDAEKLAEILKLAGLGAQSSGGCDSCGESPCGCNEQVSENQPDWPTDTATTDANDPYLRRFSGGLNGAKSTGQTTIPVIASQIRRQTSMEENVELERSLFKTWKTYKGQ